MHSHRGKARFGSEKSSVWCKFQRIVRILRPKVCFDASTHIPFVFARRVVNNIHIVNTTCWLKSKYLRIYNKNLQKQVPFFKQGGGGARRAGPGSAFVIPYIKIYNLYYKVIWYDTVRTLSPCEHSCALIYLVISILNLKFVTSNVYLKAPFSKHLWFKWPQGKRQN